MTITSLILGTIISQILFVILKIVFLESLNLDNWLVWVGYILALVIVTIATVRRMGIINYYESFFLATVWLITTLMVDYVILTRVISLDIYVNWNYWMSYIVVIVSLLIFHKKLHVQIRKANAK